MDGYVPTGVGSPQEGPMKLGCGCTAMIIAVLVAFAFVFFLVFKYSLSN